MNFIKLIGSSGHVNYLKLDDIVAINICEDWDKPTHLPRIDIVMSSGAAVEMEYCESNLAALKLAGMVDVNYIYIPKPEGWIKPEAPKHPMEQLTEMMMTQRARALADVGVEIDDEDKPN